MPRLGLRGDDVVAAAAELMDEVGDQNLTMGLLAQRLGVRTPSLYKHVESLADLRHRVATRTVSELGEAIRDAVQGRSGADAVGAFAHAIRQYVAAHPARYAATIGVGFGGPDDPLLSASTRVVESIAAVLGGYGIGADEMGHAVRTVRCLFHGFAALHAAGGFQWNADPEESFDWMIRFVDRGLRASGPAPGDQQ